MYYVIRHKPTGWYLPAIYRGRGQTHFEFTDKKFKRNAAPRLFGSLQIAKAWLTVYCRGPIVQSWSEHFEYGRQYEGLEHDTSRARNRALFDIVRVTLNIGDPV